MIRQRLTHAGTALIRHVAIWWQWMRSRRWRVLWGELQRRDMLAMRAHVQAVPRQIWLITGVMVACLTCGLCSFAASAPNAPMARLTPHTPIGTAKSTPSPLPRPTATSAPTATPGAVPVRLVAAIATNHQISHITVQTAPGASASITVTYCSGHTAKGGTIENTLIANASGYVTWNWTPETTCVGKASAYVVVTHGNQLGTLSFDFPLAG